MNLSTLRDRVARTIGLENTTSGEQGLIDGWLNEGYEDILMKTRCNVDSASMATTDGVEDYNLDTDILEIIDIFFTGSDGAITPLERVSPYEILQYRRAQHSSSPSRFYALAGADLLMLYPTPGANAAVTIYYTPRPSALSATGQEPSDIPSQWHKLVEMYANWRAADFDDDTTSQQGDRYRALYELGIREFRQDLRRRGGTRLGPAKVGRRTQRYPSRNDQDIG